MSLHSEPLVVMPVERKDGTYALRLCLNQGLLTQGMLRRIMEVMADNDTIELRATTGQRMNIEGVAKDQLDNVVAALGASVPQCPPGVSVCPGGGICKMGRKPTRDLGDKLLDTIKANGPYPFKIKTGVSGCLMGCGLSFVRDIGLVASGVGWKLYYGGVACSNAGVGVLLGTKLSEDEVISLVEKGLRFYKENGKKRERIGAMVQRLGYEAILTALVPDS